MRSGGRSLALGFVGGLFALTTIAHAEFNFDVVFDGSEEIVKLAELEEAKFKHTFTNTGDEMDTYRMTCSATYYHGGDFDFLWTLCTTEACVLPGVLTDITLAPATSDTVTLKVIPIGLAGSSRVSMTFESIGSGSMETFDYIVIKDGTEIIIIDDDGGAGYENDVAAGLALGAQSYGVYSTELQPLSDASFTLDDAGCLIYISGDESTDTISEADGLFLGAYLDGGGRMIASGQDLFDDISGSAFADYLGAYKVGESTMTMVNGVGGDPVGNGLSFSIANGANNQVTPDELVTSYVPFEYGDGATAGARRETTTYKTVSLGFGMEAMAPADINGLVSAAKTWFDAVVVAVPGAGPRSLVDVTAYPNPLQANGHLRLALPDGFNGDVSVSLFDASGRQVATVFDGVLAGGTQVLPVTGRDISGRTLSPGIYHYRVTMNGVATGGGKLTFVR